MRLENENQQPHCHPPLHLHHYQHILLHHQLFLSPIFPHALRFRGLDTYIGDAYNEKTCPNWHCSSDFFHLFHQGNRRKQRHPSLLHFNLPHCHHPSHHLHYRHIYHQFFIILISHTLQFGGLDTCSRRYIGTCPPDRHRMDDFSHSALGRGFSSLR